MEYLEGKQINDLEYIKKNKIDPFDVSNKLGILYSKMIFINGYVHSDPHPGNILVHKNKNGGTDIILLDHGLYAVSIFYHAVFLILINNFVFRRSLIASATNTHNFG